MFSIRRLRTRTNGFPSDLGTSAQRSSRNHSPLSRQQTAHFRYFGKIVIAVGPVVSTRCPCSLRSNRRSRSQAAGSLGTRTTRTNPGGCVLQVFQSNVLVTVTILGSVAEFLVLTEVPILVKSRFFKRFFRESFFLRFPAAIGTRGAYV
jgi:hypothetical protein